MASSNLSCFHMAPTSEFKGRESIPFKGGEVGIFSFVILDISFVKFLVFALKKLGFLVLVSLLTIKCSEDSVNFQLKTPFKTQS